MTKVLVVDDIRTLKPKFSCDLVHARTSEEALECLRNSNWDVIFLDHDLGGDDTTIPVARYIEASDINAQVFIHSQNPVGRKNLLFEIPEAKEVDLMGLL